MYQLNKQLTKSNVAYAKRQELLQTTLKQLQEGQKTGKTAKAMFGTPTQHADHLLHPKQEDSSQNLANQSMWLLAADNALIFLAIFTGMFAIMGWLSPKSLDVKINGTSGITSIILISILGGFIFSYVAKAVLPRVVHGKAKRPPFWRRALIILGGLVVWMVVFFAGNMLPNVINPRPNQVVYIVIALVAIGADIWFRRQFNIVGILGSNQRQRARGRKN